MAKALVIVSGVGNEVPEVSWRGQFYPTGGESFTPFTDTASAEITESFGADALNEEIMAAVVTYFNANYSPNVLAADNIILQEFGQNQSLSSVAFSAYAAGTAYNLTSSFAKVDFGTTDPAITITSPGKYLIMAGVRIDYVGATLAAVRDVSVKVRRTNNTAADVPDTSAFIGLQIATLLTAFAARFSLPMVAYETSNDDDTLELQGMISVVPTFGNVQVTQAFILAIKI